MTMDHSKVQGIGEGSILSFQASREAINARAGFISSDEYKVMGLVPYGEPRFIDAMRRIVLLHDAAAFELNLDFFRHHRKKIDYEWDDGEPVLGNLFSDKLDGWQPRRSGMV